VHIGQGGAGSVVAAKRDIEKQSGTVLVIARRVEGNVRTMLDWRGALAFGAALGIAGRAPGPAQARLNRDFARSPDA